MTRRASPPISSWIYILVAAATTSIVAVLMELWAAWVHRVLWHGPLWPLHRSHHSGERDVDPHKRRLAPFELNDLFGPLHAALAVWLTMAGLSHTDHWLGAVTAGIGFGMTLFGVGYWLIHDGLSHGRLPGIGRLPFRYLRRLKGAHTRHHRTGGIPYGFFAAPYTLRREAQKRIRPNPSNKT